MNVQVKQHAQAGHHRLEGPGAGLQLRNIWRRYGDHAAVADVSLDVRRGELVTLLGPSGCGKTTTLRMIAGFVEPDEGEILFDGRRMNSVAPFRRNTAMVFQSYALFPHMTVADNIAFGLKMRKIPADEQRARIAEAVAMVSLTGLEARRPGQLSGGQQQRVALARAIVTRPDILLFDEPLSNLDAKLREKVRLEIRELQQRLGLTSIYVTHDQVEAMAISDRIVVMNGGRIEQIGAPADIYHNPQTAFVADFLGAANLVGGTVEGPRIRTALGVFDLPAPAGNGAVTLCIRPEDIAIGPEGEKTGIDGIIRTIVFCGSYTEVVVEASGQVLRVHAGSAFSGAVGDRCFLSVASGKIRILG